MEVRVNRIGRATKHGTGNDSGGSGSNPPPAGGIITNITTDTVNPLGTFAQVNCQSVHGLANGERVTISGNSQANYNGTFIVQVSGQTTFEINTLYTVDGTDGTWVPA